jgi:hypothetical protein
LPYIFYNPVAPITAFHIGVGVEKYCNDTYADLPVVHEFGRIHGANAPPYPVDHAIVRYVAALDDVTRIIISCPSAGEPDGV